MINNKVQQEDIHAFISTFALSNEIAGSRVLITGGTGLIGSSLTHCLSALNLGVQITLPVRNGRKAEEMFMNEEGVKVLECDLVDYLKKMDGDYDYVIHCASPTVGKYMTEHPVETFCLAYESTKAILDYGRKHQTKGIVYISSLESYGQVLNDVDVEESYQGFVDLFDLRSSYPMGKRAAEFLCIAYAKQYNVPIRVARLTQTFGAGVSKEDNRVFAQFARSVIEGKDIVLHTNGESAKPYLYTTDCVEAILYILLHGKDGDVYNVSNDNTFISIIDLANFLCEHFNSNISVHVKPQHNMGYAPVTRLKLSSSKLQSLGWQPHYNLEMMFKRLIDGFKHESI